MNHITSSQGLDDVVEAYHQHLLQTRGLAPGTCAYYVSHVRAFLTEQWKGSSHDLDLSRLDAPTLVGYVAEQRRHLQPSSLQRRATSLRSFLRFLALSGQAPATLVEAVPKIQIGPRQVSPHYLSLAQLERVLATLDPQTPQGARDAALIHCLAHLGLRAGEAAGLVLEDFNWRAGSLRLQRTKSRRERLLPVPPAVGQAIVRYLQRARPPTAHRRVFVSLPEGDPFSSQAISQLVSQALRQAQVIFPRSGAQLLRRTFATHLVQQGVGVKAIADLLGHRSLNNTAFYAQVNLPQLQALTQPWPEVAR